MGWLKDFFTLPRWFYWTVASDAIRDARKDPPHPRKDHYREVNYYKNLLPDSSPPINGGEKETKHLSFYEAEMIGNAEERIEHLYEKWQEVKQGLESKAKKIKHHLDGLLKEYDRLVRRHKEKDFKQPHQILPKWLYVPVMVIVGLLEMPFNVTAFKILRVSPGEIYLMALGPSIAIPFLAHFLGTKIRHWPKEGADWKIILVTIFSGVSLLIGLGAIGFLRAEYIAYETKAEINLRHALALLGINLIFLAMGTIAAYFAHDPDRELERICKEMRMLRNKLYNKVWNTWSQVAAKYDTYRGTTITKINMIKTDTIGKVDEYRHYNTMFRPDNVVPSWFNESIDDGFFKHRYFGNEMDRTPDSLDKTLEEIEKNKYKEDEHEAK